jgi:polyhydroxybutyrate depolymerase
MTRTVLVAVCCCFALLPARTGHAQDIRTIEHQGVARSYLLVNRSAAAGGAKPVFVALHSRRDPGEPLTSDPRLDQLAEREGFVAVYPAAIDGKWNYGGEVGSLSRAGSEVADDTGFLRKLIDSLISEKIADPLRIYVSGSSQGGFLAYSVACEFADKVAAVAIGLASMTEPQIASCKPQRAVPMLVIAGTNDSIVPYDGWLVPGERLTSVPETLEFWQRLHHCTGQKAKAMPHRISTNPTRVVLVEWTGCEIEGALRLYRVQGGGHRRPTFEVPSVEEQRALGFLNQDFEVNDEVWRFFRKFSR